MQRAEYVATRPVDFNGARAYNPGDPVDARAVDGPDAWVAREDVEAAGVIPLNPPAKNAPQGLWAAYAVQQGMDPGKAADASRGELIKAYGGK